MPYGFSMPQSYGLRSGSAGKSVDRWGTLLVVLRVIIDRSVCQLTILTLTIPTGVVFSQSE